MSNTTTIAIIGVAGKKELFIATLLAAKYQVLLFDHDQEKLPKDCNQVMLPGKSTNPEAMQCPTDASWQADVIILTGYHQPDQLIAEKICRVATQKIVFVFMTETDNELFPATEFTWQQLLPHSKLTTVFGADLNDEKETCKLLIMESNDKQALEAGAALFKTAGFKIQTLFTPFISMSFS